MPSEAGGACDTPDPITFVSHFLINDARQLTCSFFNGAINVIRRHIVFFGLGQNRAKSGIGIRISTAVFGCNRDFLDKFCKNSPALGVQSAFFMFNRRPLRMSRHTNSSLKKQF